MTAPSLALLGLLLLLAGGCAAVDVPHGSHLPRSRCLADPAETGTRPLFLLLCVESP